jgi:hypothetical protein
MGGDIVTGTKEVERRDSVKLVVGVNDVIEMSNFTVDNNTCMKEELRLRSKRVAQCVLNGQ